MLFLTATLKSITNLGHLEVDIYPCDPRNNLFDRLEPIMLKNLPIIPSRTSQKFYPLFLIYSQIITYYSFITLLILLGQ